MTCINRLLHMFASLDSEECNRPEAFGVAISNFVCLPMSLLQVAPQSWMGLTLVDSNLDYVRLCPTLGSPMQ